MSVERPQPRAPARRPSARHRAQLGFTRAVATGGVVAIGVALGAILVHNNVAGWIVGLVISVVSLLLGAMVRRARPPS